MRYSRFRDKDYKDRNTNLRSFRYLIHNLFSFSCGTKIKRLVKYIIILVVFIYPPPKIFNDIIMSSFRLFKTLGSLEFYRPF